MLYRLFLATHTSASLPAGFPMIDYLYETFLGLEQHCKLEDNTTIELEFKTVVLQQAHI